MMIGGLAPLLLGGLVWAYPVRSQQLSPTPPMGWNSWYALHTNISDAAVREAADVLVSSGLRDKGYVYVNLDAWSMGCRPVQSRRSPSGCRFLKCPTHPSTAPASN